MSDCSLESVFALGCLFQDAEIRYCEIDGIQHANIFDVIKVFSDHVTSSANWTAKTWKRVKESHPDFETHSKIFHFPGTRGAGSPVADAALLMRIVYKLPGETAKKFSDAGWRLFLQTLDPSEEYLAELRDHMENVRNGRDTVNTFLVDTPEKRVRMAARPYEETYLYVRMRMPDIYVAAGTSHKKPLTMDILKFGITHAINDRHAGYDNDDGYMAMAFKCAARREAEIVENALRYEYRDITAYGSYEYVQTPALAEKLGVEYEAGTGSYETYATLAQALYVRFVRAVDALWPGKYTGQYGQSYGIEETAPRSSAKALAPLGEERLDLELKFPATDITPAIARDMGFLVPDDAIESQPLRTFKAITPAPSTSTASSSSAIVRTPKINVQDIRPEPPTRYVPHRTGGPVVRRNIETGVDDRPFINISAATAAFDVGKQTLSRSYLDKPRQILGYTLRTVGAHIWQPTPELVYDATKIDAGAVKYLKAVDGDGKLVVYESRNAAVQILGLSADDVKVLNTAIATSLVFHDASWDWVHESDAHLYGTWTPDDADWSEALGRWSAPPDEDVTGRDMRSNGMVIRLDLVTGKEKKYASIHEAAERNDMHDLTLKDGLLDQPRQAAGKAYRTIDAKVRWEPSEIFKFDGTSVEKRNARYIIAMDAAGVSIAMYEGATAAGRIERIDGKRVAAVVGKNVEYAGLTWRLAEPTEYATWVPADADAEPRPEASPFPFIAAALPEPKPRIIRRDLQTGEETPLKNIERAFNDAKVSGPAFKKTVLGHPRQVRGKTYRLEGTRIWIPPADLTYEADHFEPQWSGTNVLATAPDGKTYTFESVCAAARLLSGDASRRTLSDHVKAGTTYAGFIWGKAPEPEWTNDSTDERAFGPAPTAPGV